MNTLSAWERERLDIVLRACRSLKLHNERGESIWGAAKIVSRRYHRWAFKADPKRRLKLAPGTLVQAYYRWKHAAESPAVLASNYAHGRRAVSATVALRFVKFASARYWPSLRAAWLAFCKQSGSKPRYDQLRRNLPRNYFEPVNRRQRLIALAQKEIDALRTQAVAEIRARMPVRMPRRQPKSVNFEK